MTVKELEEAVAGVTLFDNCLAVSERFLNYTHAAKLHPY